MAKGTRRSPNTSLTPISEWCITWTLPVLSTYYSYHPDKKNEIAYHLPTGGMIVRGNTQNEDSTLDAIIAMDELMSSSLMWHLSPRSYQSLKCSREVDSKAWELFCRQDVQSALSKERRNRGFVGFQCGAPQCRTLEKQKEVGAQCMKRCGRVRTILFS